MSEEEKENNPNYENLGGYLKTYSYKEAWKKSWNEAKEKENWEKEYNLLINLPNFDAEVFEEITGINIKED
jgi:hypothetical protein